jgi:hypothetical protein
MSNYDTKIIPPGAKYVKVPLTGGLAVLGVGKAVGRKRGGGGYGFQKCVVEYAK